MSEAELRSVNKHSTAHDGQGRLDTRRCRSADNA